MQVFKRATIAKVSKCFYWYYNKSKRNITEYDALDLVNSVLGGGYNQPKALGSMDYSKPTVVSSPINKPSPERICEICEKYEASSNDWDSVFDKLLKEISNDKIVMQFIMLVFAKQFSEAQVCDTMHFERSTYYRYRINILNKAAVIATIKGLL